MNQFEYILKVEEMKQLKTKKAKADFIRQLSRNSQSVYALKLYIDAQTYFTDTTISGVKSLQYAINSHRLWQSNNCTLESFTILGDIPKTAMTTSKVYDNFMYCSGIPAYMKAIILKAKLEEETCLWK